ncbi:hypothetical protein [Bacillus phage vB_BanS-Thrax5]|nr:hypothetical protein [Bacillus phage vB_BanS-Thrax5]
MKVQIRLTHRGYVIYCFNSGRNYSLLGRNNELTTIHYKTKQEAIDEAKANKYTIVENSN